MKKYLATDLDGTLLYPKLKYTFVSKENVDVINQFKNNTIIVSGRNQSFVRKICKYLAIDETYIACNGAYVCYKGKPIFIKHINTELVNNIITYVLSEFKEYKIILFDTQGKLYSLSNDIIATEKKEKEFHKQFPKHSYRTNNNLNTIHKLLKRQNCIIKVIVSLKDKEKSALYQYLLTKELPLSYAMCKHALEITGENVTKGEALTLLTSYMHIKENDVYVIGDDKNDLSMFNKYTNSFLINHGNNLDLKPCVKHVLNKFNEITHYIKEE